MYYLPESGAFVEQVNLKKVKFSQYENLTFLLQLN